MAHLNRQNVNKRLYSALALLPPKEAARGLAAAETFARVANGRVEHWLPVARPVPGQIYDFACPVTGITGQCWQTVEGVWKQAPRGEHPVILEYIGAPRKRVWGPRVS